MSATVKGRPVACVALLAAAVSSVACGSESPTDGAGSPSPDVGDWNGTWDNDTAKRPLITFTVSGSRVSSAVVRPILIYPIVSGGNILSLESCTDTLTAAGSVALDGASFAVPVSSTMTGGESVFRGTFSMDAAVTGTLDAYSYAKVCDGSALGGSLQNSQQGWSGTR